jgi:hypothetical protein
MSISFTQSMQSLHADHGRSSLWGISVAILLLIVWLIWFFTPSVTVYANGRLIKLTRSGTLVAEVPAQESRHLRAGQTARIYPQGTTNPQQTLPATVQEVVTHSIDDQVQIILYPDGEVKRRFVEGVNGAVQVEVESISPAILLLRASGLAIETSPVALSPQAQR